MQHKCLVTVCHAQQHLKHNIADEHRGIRSAFSKLLACLNEKILEINLFSLEHKTRFIQRGHRIGHVRALDDSCRRHYIVQFHNIGMIQGAQETYLSPKTSKRQ